MSRGKKTILIADISDEDVGLPLSDMMAGLMLIFLLIAISLMAVARTAQEQAESEAASAYRTAENLSATTDLLRQERDQIEKLVDAWDQDKLAVYLRLLEEFKDYLPIWKAEIIKDDLIIRFNEPEVLFEQNSARITDRFEHILNAFFPRYVEVLQEFGERITEVRIEGHTSSEWNDKVTSQQAYFLNMKLSQNRTRGVLEYGFNMLSSRKSLTWARSKFVASGMSSSRLIKRQGIEDQELSRRVEFRVITDAEQKIAEILRELSDAPRD